MSLLVLPVAFLLSLSFFSTFETNCVECNIVIYAYYFIWKYKIEHYLFQIVEHHNKKSRKHQKPELEEEKTTTFTDRDFDKFEKEYDFE